MGAACMFIQEQQRDIISYSESYHSSYSSFSVLSYRRMFYTSRRIFLLERLRHPRKRATRTLALFL